MAVYTNNSAGAASGTSVTAANSDDNAAGDAFSVTSGTRIYDNTWSHSGTTSFKCSGAGAAGLLGWNVGTTGNASFKGWFWFSSLPAATQSILQCRIASPDSNGGDVMVQSNGRLRFGTSGWVSNTVLSTSTAYRLEACYTAGASSITGRVRIAIFLGDDLIPLETYSIDETNTGTTTFSGFRFGKVTSSGTWDVWFDDVTYNDGGTSFISSGITLKEGAVRDARSKVAGTASTSETITLPDFVSGDSIIMVVARDTTSANTFSGDSDCSVTEIVTGNRKISALLLTPANGSITSFVLSNSTSAKWRWWVGSIVGIDPSYAIEAAHSDIGSNTTNAMAIPTITTSHGDTVPNGVSIAGASVTTTATWSPIASTFFYSASGDTAMSVGFKPVTEGSGTVTWSDFDRGNNGSSRDESVLSLYLRPFDAEATAVAVTSISSSGILKAIANPDDVVSTSSIACSADVIPGLVEHEAEAQADAVTSASASANYIPIASATVASVSSVSVDSYVIDYGLGTLAATSSVSVSANSVLLAAADTSSAVSAVSVDAVVRSSASASAAAVSSVSVSSVVISYSSATVSAVSSVSASALSVTYASTVSAAVSDVSISSATQYAYGIAASNVVSAVSGAATVLMYGTALSSVVSSVSISGYTADYGIASVDIVSVASAAAVLRSYGQASVVSTSELSLSGLAVLFSSVSISSSFSVSVSATAVYVGSAVCITSSLVEVVFAEAVITPAYVSPIVSVSSIVVVGGLLFEASVSTSALASTVEVHIYKDMPALRNLSAENMSSFYDATSLSVVGEGALTADLLPFSDAALLVDTDFGDLTEVVSAEASLSL